MVGLFLHYVFDEPINMVLVRTVITNHEKSFNLLLHQSIAFLFLELLQVVHFLREMPGEGLVELICFI